MTIELPKTKFPEQVVEDVIRAALRDEANLARLRADRFANECRTFEERFINNIQFACASCETA